MAEYIERRPLFDALFDADAITAKGIDIFRNFPAADVRPVVRAVWRRYSPFTDTYECSNCGEQVIDQQFRTNFCHNCGADMRPQPPKEET